MEEAKARVPEDMWQIFWEGRPYPLTGTLIPRDSMIRAVIRSYMIYYNINIHNTNLI